MSKDSKRFEKDAPRQMSLRELSRMLELSQTTISRALNGYPEVNKETRARVVAAAERTGYRPNRAALRLATGRANSIGMVMPTGQGRDTDIHFAEFLSGLGEAAEANDVQLVIQPSKAEDELATFRKLASSGTVDAVYIAYIRVEDPRISLLKSMPIPFVVHGRSLGDVHDYPFLDIDNEGAFYDAARLLLQLGHRDFAVLNAPQYLTFASRRHTGVLKALNEAGVALDPSFVRDTPMTEEFGYKGMRAFLQSDNPPTALLCSSVVLALGAVRAANELGFKIGQDISIIAHDDVFPYLRPENFSVPLTTTRSSIRQAGKRIAERLITARGGRRTGEEPLQELWKTELVLRASTGAAPEPKGRLRLGRR